MIAIPEYKNSTSQHPLTDITLGEGLIKETYEAIRGSVATTCALAYSRFCFRERLLTAPLEGIWATLPGRRSRPLNGGGGPCVDRPPGDRLSPFPSAGCTL